MSDSFLDQALYMAILLAKILAVIVPLTLLGVLVMIGNQTGDSRMHLLVPCFFYSAGSP